MISGEVSVSIMLPFYPRFEGNPPDTRRYREGSGSRFGQNPTPDRSVGRGVGCAERPAVEELGRILDRALEVQLARLAERGREVRGKFPVPVQPHPSVLGPETLTAVLLLLRFGRNRLRRPGELVDAGLGTLAFPDLHALDPKDPILGQSGEDARLGQSSDPVDLSAQCFP